MVRRQGPAYRLAIGRRMLRVEVRGWIAKKNEPKFASSRRTVKKPLT